MNEKISKLKSEAETKSQKLAFERQKLLDGSQQIQKRLQDIDVDLIKLSGEIQAYSKLIEE